MIKSEHGSYTDPKTGLKVNIIKTADDKIKGIIKISGLIKTKGAK
jgi:hypothetical protein